MDYSTINTLTRLKKEYPWPKIQPSCTHLHWSLDGGGKELVSKIIKEKNSKVLLEIGVFFGGSLKTWLDTNPTITTVAVDLWDNDRWWAEYAKAHGRESFYDQLAAKNGPFNTFLATMWDYQNRIIPVRARWEESLPDLHRLGLQPDIIFIDADKAGNILELCSQLFPNAVIAGDDWNWGDEEGYPMRTLVRQFARKNGLWVKQRGETWVLTENLPSVHDFIYMIKKTLLNKAQKIKIWFGL